MSPLIYLRQSRPTRVLGGKAQIEAHVVREAYAGLGRDAAVAVDTIAGLVLALSRRESPFKPVGFGLIIFVCRSKERIPKPSSLPRGGMFGNISQQMIGHDFRVMPLRPLVGHGKDNIPVKEFPFIIAFDGLTHKFPKIVRLDDNIRYNYRPITRRRAFLGVDFGGETHRIVALPS